MAAPLRIGAVTVTYNSGAVIDSFIACVLTQSHSDFRLYAVDNASHDSTVTQIEQYRDSRVTVIRNSTNVGFAEATNQGIRAALADGCDAVLLINNDTEFNASLFDLLACHFYSNGIQLVAPKILYHHDQHRIWSAGGGFRALKGYAGFHYGLDQMDSGQFDQTAFVDHAPACCLLVGKEVFAKIGLMDSRYFVYLEDTDFCFRAKKAGFRIAYVPDAVMLHKASSLTGGPESDFSVRYRTRNQVYFMLKHLGLLKNAFYLPAFQFYQLTKLLSRKIGLHGYVLRQQAFLQGLQLWKESLHTKETVRS